MKKYGIIADTSCETNEEMREKYDVTYASFKIDIDDKTYVDNENLDIDEFIDHMNESPNPIKTACPAPGEYVDALEKNLDADELFIITISSKLSGSYEAANLAKNVFLEEHPEKKVHVIDSKSAVAGETLVYLKLTELLDKELEFEKIVSEITDYVDNKMQTLFVLEDLSNLIKNGRMNKPAGFIANMLSIKPVMRSNDGEIELHELARGINNSLNKMAKAVGEFVDNTIGKTITISHVRAPEKAELMFNAIKDLYEFARIEVMEARGLSSGYAADKGVVVAFEKE